MKTSRFTYEMTENRAKISDKKTRRDKIMVAVNLRSWPISLVKIWLPNLCLCDSVVLQINKSHCTERFVNLPCDCLHPLIWSWDGFMVDTQGGKINHRYSWHGLHYIWKKYLNLFAYYLCRCLALQCVQIQRKFAWALPEINMSRYILQSRYFLPCTHEQLLNWKNSKKHLG